jgi:hypothetical protein
VEDIVIQIHAPYTDKSVTVLINPNSRDFQKNTDPENSKISQWMKTTVTEKTKELFFDFDENKRQNITIENIEYEIELLNIGKENARGNKFPFFEFNITKGK